MTTSTDLHPEQCAPRSRPRRGRALFGLLAFTLGIGAAAACSSADAKKSTAGATADSGANGTGGGSAADSGNAAGSGNATDGGDGTAALCDTFFDALAKCPAAASSLEGRGFFPSGLDKLPKTETDRLRALYRAHCTERAALPGTGFDQTSVSACLAAIDKEGCNVTPTTRAACTFKGTLPAGSACVVAEQCADFDCFSVSNCGGPGPFGGSASCGVCRKAPAVGDACDFSQSCGPNATCVFGADPIKSPTGVCTATTTRAAGEACTGRTDVCADGLYCDLPSPFGAAATSTCKALLGEGQACTNQGACKAPLSCSFGASPAAGKCQAQPAPNAGGTAGAGCNSDSECAADLGCVLTPSSGPPLPGASAGKCAAITFAEPGAACDASIRCRVGSCPGTFTAAEDGGFPAFSPAGTCPKLIADGEACTDKPPVTPIPGASGSDGVCDAFSTCVNGKCTPVAYPTCDATAAATAPLKCPDPLVVACPTAAPADGDACPSPTPSAGQSVIYPGDCSYDTGKTKCGCVPSMGGPLNGSLSWACNTCPATQPTPGDSCASSSGPKGPFPIQLQCAYADVTCGCGGFGPNGSTWTCGSCPATAPKSGDACDVPMGMECDFGAAKCTCSFGPPMAGPPSGTIWSCQ